MKQQEPAMGIKKLCRLFGKSRHAWYDHQWRYQDIGLKEEIILQHVHQVRESLPRTGTLKLHYMLTPMLAEHDIRIGRDYLFDLMREHGLDIRRRKRRVVTTDSRHWMHKYANLVKELRINRPEQVWVSDITYIRMNSGWGYLSLVTDAYSRKIMGYCFHKDLAAQGCAQALRMALDNRIYQDELIHHSDRGSQYCSKEYVSVLLGSRIAISMTENGDPYENALAERVNGILKEEFNLHHSGLGFDDTKRKIAESIRAYNELRPHASCDYLTPDQAHLRAGVLMKRWKNKKSKKEELALV
ncbi:transposase InsO family protein [Arcticibacter tournemirensis]|uniref:IS3 family transposase n=1 Tax=Arcticibacter tournemirensis TaxID=699437 RepID=UPI0011520EAB|nr:IS3 family transposase [Arcticibacter tournemirensis]TQM49509.1 transposase InsO family protein [Arcticibacter tournemirensis]TQM50832.1 transposase InsO family protein [Arcticibacter tournemirensis]TQM51923.1 transposase InsO family protein [Arcticibacter tournemirensis]